MAPPLEKVAVTTPLEDIKEILDREGCVILTKALSKQGLHRLHGELEKPFQMAGFCEGLFFGHGTKRLHSLMARSGACREMAVHPRILEIMEGILGPYCDKIQLNLTQGIQIWPGEKAQILHRDDSMFPLNTKVCEFMANAMWAYSDFTADNGATLVVPGSHLWEDRERIPVRKEIVEAEMQAGDVLIYLGSLIHAGGENRSQKARTGIAIGYCLGWLRQYENQYFAAPPHIARHFPERLQDLLGYCVHRPNLGMYEGNEPKILLKEMPPHTLKTHDWLTPRQTQEVQRFYTRQ